MSKDYEMCAVLVEAECRDKLTTLTKAEDVLAITMKVAHNHWMYTDEQTQFKGGIGAALLHLESGEEFDRVNAALSQLGKVSALLHALQQCIPVNFEEIDIPKADSVIPLREIWNNAKAQQ